VVIVIKVLLNEEAAVVDPSCPDIARGTLQSMSVRFHPREVIFVYVFSKELHLFEETHVFKFG
jgi:hypothetical protein